MNYLILFGFSAVGLARLLYGITQNEYFSESNTNAYNLYFQFLAQMLMVGSGAVIGISSLNYSAYAAYSKLQQVSQFHHVTTSFWTSSILPFLLSLASITMIDQMNLYSAIPMVLSVAIFMTSIYIKTSALSVPLWFGKNMIVWCMFQIFLVSITGATMLNMNYKVDEYRKIINNYQKVSD